MYLHLMSQTGYRLGSVFNTWRKQTSQNYHIQTMSRASTAYQIGIKWLFPRVKQPVWDGYHLMLRSLIYTTLLPCP